MYQKIKLLLSDSFAVTVATHKIAIMLSNYLAGRDHVLEIGSEQGDIGVWDDLILRHSGGLYEHLQVKRQTTPFDDSNSCIRTTYDQGKRKGTLRDLSAFDKSMESLAIWVANNNPSTSIPKRKFVFVLPDNSISIKNDYTVREFNILCDTYIQPTTTVAQMEELANDDPVVNSGYIWLCQWCGFSNWEHVLMALKQLHVNTGGDENDLKEKINDLLNPFFTNLPAVIAIIDSLVRTGAPAPNSLTPRYILSKISPFLRPDMVRWTQYAKTSTRWTKNGIQDLKDIEAPLVIVNGFWSHDNSTILKYHDNGFLGLCPISTALVRLALHFSGDSTFQVANPIVWESLSRKEIGGTLGLDEFDCKNLSFQPYIPFETIEVNDLDDLTKQREEANNLHGEMDKITRAKVFDHIQDKIQELPDSEISKAVEKRWTVWKIEFENNTTSLGDLFKEMMRPEAEGTDIEVSLRIGPKTVHLLGNGIFLLMIISIGYDPENENWSLVNDHNIAVKALKYWSGPSHQKRKVRSVVDKETMEMIKREKANCVLLSGSEASFSEYYRTSLAESYEDPQNLTETNRSKVVLTASFALWNVIDKGAISGLKDFIKDQLNNHAYNIDSLIANL